jgi:calcium-dependent protein kinase
MLRNFSQFSRVKQLSLLLLAHRLAGRRSRKEREVLEKHFFALDTNQTGRISLEELRKGVAQLSADIDVDKIFVSLDQDRTGRIKYTEFLAAAASDTLPDIASEEDFASTFRQLDADGSGYVTSENLQTVLGGSAPPEEVQHMIAEVDKSGDGRISIAEFMAAMKE